MHQCKMEKYQLYCFIIWLFFFVFFLERDNHSTKTKQKRNVFISTLYQKQAQFRSKQQKWPIKTEEKQKETICIKSNTWLACDIARMIEKIIVIISYGMHTWFLDCCDACCQVFFINIRFKCFGFYLDVTAIDFENNECTFFAQFHSIEFF